MNTEIAHLEDEIANALVPEMEEKINQLLEMDSFKITVDWSSFYCDRLEYTKKALQELNHQCFDRFYDALLNCVLKYGNTSLQNRLIGLHVSMLQLRQKYGYLRNRVMHLSCNWNDFEMLFNHDDIIEIILTDIPIQDRITHLKNHPLSAREIFEQEIVPSFEWKLGKLLNFKFKITIDWDSFQNSGSIENLKKECLERVYLAIKALTGKFGLNSIQGLIHHLHIQNNIAPSTNTLSFKGGCLTISNDWNGSLNNLLHESQIEHWLVSQNGIRLEIKKRHLVKNAVPQFEHELMKLAGKTITAEILSDSYTQTEQLDELPYQCFRRILDAINQLRSVRSSATVDFVPFDSISIANVESIELKYLGIDNKKLIVRANWLVWPTGCFSEQDYLDAFSVTGSNSTHPT